MSIADLLIAEFNADKTRWAQQPRRRLAAIQRQCSRELLEAAGFGPDTPVSRTLTGEQLYRSFYAVARDRLSSRKRLHSIPLEICNQAEEVLLALGMISRAPPSKAARPKGRGTFGRVCEFCWRTEAEPRRAGFYGRCHRHDRITAPLPGKPESGDARETRLTVRNAIDRAQRLQRASPQASLGFDNYPLLPPRPPIPDFPIVSWQDFVREHFPLSALLLRSYSDDAVATFLSTVAALEDRPLLDHELAELNAPIDALPILLRCEAWMALAQAATRGRSESAGDERRP